jgi:hypothetical protein
MAFVPCQGKTACRDNGERCLSCGRSLEEITWLRDLLDQLGSLAIEYGYDNVDEFAAYIAHKLPKMVEYRRQQSREQANAD